MEQDLPLMPARLGLAEYPLLGLYGGLLREESSSSDEDLTQKSLKEVLGLAERFQVSSAEPFVAVNNLGEFPL